jgi:hypothetical protein
MIKELINDLAFDKITLNQGLTRAKIISSKIGDSNFTNWIRSELNGYSSDENIPEYRVTQCDLKATINDFGGLRVIPIDASVLDNKYGGKIYTIRLAQDIDSLETAINESESEEIIFKMPHNLVRSFSEMTHTRLIDAGKEVQKSQLRYIVNQTKQRLIDTLIQLDETFPDFENTFITSPENKEIVQNIINNHIYGDNVNANIGIGENFKQSIQIENLHEKLAELRQLGVDESSLTELEEIVKDKDSKTTLTKITSWIGKMTTKAIEKGIEYQVPLIIEKVTDLIG